MKPLVRLLIVAYQVFNLILSVPAQAEQTQKPMTKKDHSVIITINGKDVQIPELVDHSTSFTINSIPSLGDPDQIELQIHNLLDDLNSSHSAFIISDFGGKITTNPFILNFDKNSSNTQSLVIEIDKMIDQFNQQPGTFSFRTSPFINLRNPNANIQDLKKQLEQFHIEMDPWGNNFTLKNHPPSTFRSGPFSSLVTKGLDLKDKGNSYQVSMDAQGLELSAFNIKATGNKLKVTTNKEEIVENTDQKGRTYRSRSHSSSTNMIKIPDDAILEKLKSKVQKDKLIIMIPKKGKNLQTIPEEQKKEWL